MEIQGTCADGLKLAMVELADKLPEDAHMVTTIHDELIVECPVEMSDVLGSEVPVEVEAKVCECWKEK